MDCRTSGTAGKGKKTVTAPGEAAQGSSGDAENVWEEDVPLLRLAGLQEESIVDGPGLRFVIFTQGCPHNCPGCHNPETHPYTGGVLYRLRDLLAKYDQNPLLSGITFSGGEPFVHAGLLSELAEAIHARGGNVITYTGYTYETLRRLIREGKGKDWEHLLRQTDLLIDGPYVAALRDLTLSYRGSRNQRILTRLDREALDAAAEARARSSTESSTVHLDS